MPDGKTVSLQDQSGASIMGDSFLLFHNPRSIDAVCFCRGFQPLLLKLMNVTISQGDRQPIYDEFLGDYLGGESREGLADVFVFENITDGVFAKHSLEPEGTADPLHQVDFGPTKDPVLSNKQEQASEIIARVEN